MSIDRLTAEDLLMLQADGVWPQDVGALAIFEGAGVFAAADPFPIDAVRGVIAARLHLVPRFRQLIHVPGRGLGGALWVDAPRFDLREHVRVQQLPVDAGEAELLDVTEQLRARRLDRSRPLWEMWFMPGLPEGRVGLFVRLHHAIADGRAAMSILGAFMDGDSVPHDTDARPWKASPMPTPAALLVDSLLRRLAGLGRGLSLLARPIPLLRQARAGWPAMRELLAEDPASETSMDRLVGPARRLALVRGTTREVRRIARAHDATVNDVLLAIIAGGLRALLGSRGEPVNGVTARIYVPVSLRRGLRGTVQGNMISQMVVPLDLTGSDAAPRLRRIAAETARRKARSRNSLGSMFRIGIARKLMLKAINRQRVHVTSASITGPRHPLSLAGAPMREIFPLENLIGRVGLGVAALTYAGRFDIGLIADRDTYPDLEVFASSMRDELARLGSSGPPLVNVIPARVARRRLHRFPAPRGCSAASPLGRARR
jgi:WS/DGAT/MGAT family acyltransferase